MRVGIGYDIHALKKGRKLVLGGMFIPSPRGLEGHSDGDVLLHAITDAVLGAMGAPDIGELFSDRDARFKGKDSAFFVRRVRERLSHKGLRVGHIDSTVVAEKPTLSPFKTAIRQNVAKLFKVSVSSVSVKAKTNEGFGAVGEAKAIACFAVVSLTPIRKK